jgi:hypothetical protein
MKTKLFLLLTFIAFQTALATTFVDPVAPTLSSLTYCDSNNDGFGEFDLTSQNATILAAQSGSASDYVIGYYEISVDAQIGANAILSPYFNINAWNQTVYYRVLDVNTNLFAVGSFQIIVNPIPDTSTPTDISVCDTNNDGVALFDFTPLIPQILGAINPATATVTFYTTLANADAGVNAIIAINFYVGTNQTIYARVAYNTTGCYDVVSFNLIVNPMPQSMQPNYPEFVLCDSSMPIGYETFDLNSRVNSILMGQTGMNVTFYPSLGEAQSGTNVITNLFYVNQVLYVQTLGIRITNVSTGCYSVSTMDIRINPLPALIPPTMPYTVCDENQDGIAVFDLTALIPDLTQGSNTLVTFHETLTDAQIGASSISTPYNNINPFSQIIYARGEDQLTGCYSVIQIELQVNSSPIAPELSDIQVCDADSNPQTATTFINLAQQSVEILAQQPLPASNYSVTYYHFQVDAEVGLSQIIPASNYVGTDGETIWCRVETNSTGCHAVGSFLLVVNVPLALVTPTPLQVCDDDANPNNQITTFDLTIKDSEITQGAPGHTVTYYASLLDAYANTNVISTPTAYTNLLPSIQTVGVKVTSPQGCVSYTTLDIRVWPIPTPNMNPPALAPQCDVNNPGDMLEVFDLTLNQVYIANGDPTLTFHYFPTLMNAESNANEITTPTSAVVGTNVWIRVENNRVDYQGNHCYVLVQQPLSVNPLPNPEIISNNTLNTVYVDGSNNVVQPLTLDAQLYGGYTFEWRVDGTLIPDATFSSYVVNTASPTGVSRVFTVTAEDLNTGCTSGLDSITVLQSSGVPSPLGQISQTFNPGDTLASLDVMGINVLWYASESNKNGFSTYSTPLPLNTVLVDGTTYFASQTVGGIESIGRLPVTVHMALGVPVNEIVSFGYAPNPVKNNLTLQSSKVLKSITVYTIVGQKVFEQDCNSTDIILDLSRLTIGNYILKAEGETGQKTIRIIKE